MTAKAENPNFIHMRKFLWALPYNSAPFGIRMDWSRKNRRVVMYFWAGDHATTWWPHGFNRCQVCRHLTLKWRYCNGDYGCKRGPRATH